MKRTNLRKDLSEDISYLNLCHSDYEAYYLKIKNYGSFIYKFEIDVTDDYANLTIKMESHNYGKDQLEIYETSYIFIPKTFNEKAKIDHFINDFFN